MEDITIDPEAARRAYTEVLPRLETMTADEHAALSVDVQDAAIQAIGVARFVAQPEVRARFALLPAELFDITRLDDLPTLALAAYHGFVELQVVRAGGSEAKLPLALVAEAGGVRKRMFELVEYVFREHERIKREVASIRGGTGYKDMGVDLARLARIYEENPEAVARETVNYRATDAADARRLSQTILSELSQNPGLDERQQLAIVTGIWTLLLRCYTEVQAAAEFIYRHENPETRFRSLYTRSSRRSRPAPEPAPAPAPEDPSTT
jgi:hypothetical protein